MIDVIEQLEFEKVDKPVTTQIQYFNHGIDKAIDTIKLACRMTGNEYQKKAARTINSDLTDEEKLLHALHGLAGEVGEIHSIYQKKYQGHEIDPNHVAKELGDLLWFVAEICTANGWTLEQIMRGNINKLLARYPVGFDENKSRHRKEGDI